MKFTINKILYILFFSLIINKGEAMLCCMEEKTEHEADALLQIQSPLQQYEQKLQKLQDQINIMQSQINRLEEKIPKIEHELQQFKFVKNDLMLQTINLEDKFENQYFELKNQYETLKNQDKKFITKYTEEKKDAQYREEYLVERIENLEINNASSYIQDLQIKVEALEKKANNTFSMDDIAEFIDE